MAASGYSMSPGVSLSGSLNKPRLAQMENSRSPIFRHFTDFIFTISYMELSDLAEVINSLNQEGHQYELLTIPNFNGLAIKFENEEGAVHFRLTRCGEGDDIVDRNRL